MSLLSGLYIVLHKSQKFLGKPIVTVHDDIDIFTISTVKPDVVYLSEDWTIRWSSKSPTFSFLSLTSLLLMENMANIR